MASVAKLKKQLNIALDEAYSEDKLSAETLSSLIVLVKKINETNSSNEEDEEPKRSKLITEDDNEDEDEDEEEEEEEEKPAKRNSNKKDTKVAKVNSSKKKVIKEKPAKTAKVVSTSFESADLDEADVKEMAESIELDLKKAKVSKEVDVRKLLKQIQSKAEKSSLEAMQKLAKKADIIIKQPRGRSSDEKKVRVAIVQLINGGASPFK